MAVTPQGKFMQLNDLLLSAQKFVPLKTAVVHPVTTEALLGAIEAAKKKLIIPVLIGSEYKIKAIAKQCDIDLSPYKLIDTEHSHAAAEKAVCLARAKEIDMLMKGSLHSDELLHAAINKEWGIRTDRRMSHAFICEISHYNKLIILTDCVVNTQPNLTEKKEIVQNVIDLAWAVGIKNPKIAILSAIETVTEKLPSTIDAAALCKMADRKQIQGAILDGPLAYDNAISKKSASIKEIHSTVAGDADVLVVPNLEAGNMLIKQLHYFAKTKLAGLVLGARVPIILTSRSDDIQTRIISCALGLLYFNYLQEKNKWSELLE